MKLELHEEKAFVVLDGEGDIDLVRDELAKTQGVRSSLVIRLANLSDPEFHRQQGGEARQPIFGGSDMAAILLGIMRVAADEKAGPKSEHAKKMFIEGLGLAGILPMVDVEYLDDAGVTRSRDSEVGVVSSIAGQENPQGNYQLAQEPASIAV